MTQLFRSPAGYVQGRNTIDELGDHAEDLGDNAVVLGDGLVLDLVGDRVRDSLETPAAYEPMIGTDEWYVIVEDSTDRLCEEVQDVADEYDGAVTTESDIGDPARLIVEYATEEDLDHVVLGAHGRPDERRPLYGSVSETVVRRTPVPVTVVR